MHNKLTNYIVIILFIIAVNFNAGLGLYFAYKTTGLLPFILTPLCIVNIFLLFLGLNGKLHKIDRGINEQ